MGLLFKISLRNLIRQKRRNLFLGIGIAVGVMFLVIANSFSTGLTDILMNKLIRNIFGHINVSFKEASKFSSMIRDKERIFEIINKSIDKKDVVTIEESVGMFGRAIGNGKSDNIVIVGIRNENINDPYFKLKYGDLSSFNSEKIEYPVLISEKKAETLKVKVGDTINMRVNMVTGQMQSASLKIIGIIKNENIFMNIVAFMEQGKAKKLIGYKQYETSSYHIILKNPKRDAKKYADKIWSNLSSNPISLKGNITVNNIKIDSRVIPYKNIQTIKDEFLKSIGAEGDLNKKKAVFVSKRYADMYNIKIDSELKFNYKSKFREDGEIILKVTGIYKGKGTIDNDVIIVNEEALYHDYLSFVPAENDTLFIKNADIEKYCADEWKLLERNSDSKEYQKKIRREKNEGSARVTADVVTMYEGASDILKMEYVLNLITFFAMVIIFFILLIGIINSLRMTIKERTREIGTIRAVGMQMKDVRNSFIIETLLLTIISSTAGVVMALMIIYPVGKIKFKDVDSALGTLLLDEHIHFVLNPKMILLSIGIIILIAITTAYFPANKAAEMKVADALRHYE